LTFILNLYKINNLSPTFNLIKAGKTVLEAPLLAWEAACTKKLGKIREKDPQKKLIATAQSIAGQSFTSLTTEKHAYVWAAEKGGVIHAALIADQKGPHLIIRFHAANILDKEAKGAGSFLAAHFLEESKKVATLVRLTPENASRYWRLKMGFVEYPEDRTQLYHDLKK